MSISSTLANSSLTNYVTAANLSSSLLIGGGSLNASNQTHGFSAQGQTIGGDSGNSTFYGLSITRNNTVVQVQNSDLGFVLLYGQNVSATIIQATIEAMQPYPRGKYISILLRIGLLTNVGMVVANAAYDTNVTNIQTFNNLQYHGAVSWSWQQGLMAEGIAKQLSLCGVNTTYLSPVTGSKPDWCSNTSLSTNLQQAQVCVILSVKLRIVSIMGLHTGKCICIIHRGALACVVII